MMKLKNSALNFRERNEPNRQFIKIKLYGGFGSKSHYLFPGKIYGEFAWFLMSLQSDFYPNFLAILKVTSNH